MSQYKILHQLAFASRHGIVKEVPLEEVLQFRLSVMFPQLGDAAIFSQNIDHTPFWDHAQNMAGKREGGGCGEGGEGRGREGECRGRGGAGLTHCTTLQVMACCTHQ